MVTGRTNIFYVGVVLVLLLNSKGLPKVRQTIAHDIVFPQILGDSGRVVNSLDFYLASLKSLGWFYFWCVLSSQWKAVTVNSQSLQGQL